MKVEKVIKRTGEEVDFDFRKIVSAVDKACHAINEPEMGYFVWHQLEEKDLPERLEVEQIQDMVEEILMQYNHKVAREYIRYRYDREQLRMIRPIELVDKYLDASDWRVKENASVGYSLGGMILNNSGAVTANYWLNKIYPKEIGDAHRDCKFHLHDLSMLSTYCVGHSLLDLIKMGLGGVPGKISSTPPKHLSTLVSQMVNFTGCMQNEQAGAGAFSSVDTYLAPYIKKDNLSYEEVYQCLQSLIFSLNAPSRWGCVDQDTEVLSEHGWRKYDELNVGDQIYTWNNGNLELKPIREIVKRPHNGEMHEYSRVGYSQYVTPYHRVLIKKFNMEEYTIKQSQEIIDCKTPYSLPVSFKTSSIQSELSDDEVFLAAAIYTDGSIALSKRLGGDHKDAVFIYKSPNRFGNEEIKAAAQKLGLTYTMKDTTGAFGPVIKYRFYGESARRLIRLVGSKSKIHDRFFKMDKRQANLFLTTWASFDGDEDKMLCQYDNDVIRDQLQHIAILAGKCSYIRKDRLDSGKTTNYVKIRQTENIKPKKRTKLEYEGIVWCPNTENGTAVFRHNNCVYISANSQPPFTNFTLDWRVPQDLAETNCWIGDKQVDFKYKDCQKEMDMINEALLDIFEKGDANGRSFSYPICTYNITKNFDWDSKLAQKLFEITAKYGLPYFQNFINSDLHESDVRSMCCRLRLNLKELLHRGGGLFGAAEQTGSTGVVTINLPQLGYRFKGDKAGFYKELDNLLVMAKTSLVIKRRIIEKLKDGDFYPYEKRYIHTFDTFFNTIGINGCNECIRNFTNDEHDITDEWGQSFTNELLDYINSRLSDFQEETGLLFNLEATPAEGTGYRLALHDKQTYPDIITANMNGDPYYTNSTWLPATYTDDIFEALDLQDQFQTKYTGGTVFHAYLGERIHNWKACAELIKTIFTNYRLPYLTISPTFSICPIHGYLDGEQEFCPKCRDEELQKVDQKIEQLEKELEEKE